MTRILPLALLTPTAALAHPWGHDGFTIATLLDHFATQPDHAVMILAVVTAAAWLGYRLWARK